MIFAKRPVGTLAPVLKSFTIDWRKCFAGATNKLFYVDESLLRKYPGEQLVTIPAKQFLPGTSRPPGEH
ncbi:MAG: hypothetical protein WKF70_12355 [Chitinophagaceae bacterium]